MNLPVLRKLRINSKKFVGRDTVAIELVDPLGDLLPEFEAGAHLDLHLPGGLIRQYSLCNTPGERHRYVIGVLRSPTSSGGSVVVHDHLSEGDLIEVSSPRNHFGLVDNEAPVLLLAGGIGITPLMSMAETLQSRQADFSLHVFSRSEERVPFREYLQSSQYASKIHIYVDEESSGGKPDLATLVNSPSRNTEIFVCGPPGFIQAIFSLAKKAGFPKNQLHCEYFENQSLTEVSTCAEFDVHLIKSGKSLRIPADRSIVEVLESEGIVIPVSCEQGICGTCLTEVCAGVPDHRDLYLTDVEKAANNKMTPCCSRSLTANLSLNI